MLVAVVGAGDFRKLNLDDVVSFRGLVPLLAPLPPVTSVVSGDASRFRPRTGDRFAGLLLVGVKVKHRSFSDSSQCFDFELPLLLLPLLLLLFLRFSLPDPVFEELCEEEAEEARQASRAFRKALGANLYLCARSRMFVSELL